MGATSGALCVPLSFLVSKCETAFGHHQARSHYVQRRTFLLIWCCLKSCFHYCCLAVLLLQFKQDGSRRLQVALHIKQLYNNVAFSITILPQHLLILPFPLYCTISLCISLYACSFISKLSALSLVTACPVRFHLSSLLLAFILAALLYPLQPQT